MLRASALRLVRLAAWSLLLLGAPAARAVQYEVEIDVEGEEGLRALLAEGQLSPTSFDALLGLLRNPIDLNGADRDALYALPNLSYREVDALLAARERLGSLPGLDSLSGPGLLTAGQARRLRPFVVPPATAASEAFSGRIALGTAYAPSDLLAPPGLLQARLTGPWKLRGGFAATTTRQRLAEVSVDRARHALTAAPPRYSLQVPKLFLLFAKPRWSVLVGSFRAGFGQRLTLDTAGRPAAEGFYPDDLVSFGAGLASYCRYSKGERANAPCSVPEQNTYVTPDFTWSESFRGVAVDIEAMRAGEVALRLRGFGSYQSRSAYQYDLYDGSLDPKRNRRCSDPRHDTPECAPPRVFVQQRDARSPAAAFSYTSLPGLYDELAVGANAAVSLGARAHFGATTYYAVHRWDAPGLELDLQEGARAPFGGPFGAAGFDARFGRGPLDFAAEVSRSFDSVPGGGGDFAAVQRTVAALGRGELTVDLRYFGRDHLNPYAHAPAASDEYEGSRSRNELGARARFTRAFGEAFSVRVALDLWKPPHPGPDGARGPSNLDAWMRGDWRVSRALRLAAWLDHRDKDLGRGGAGECFDTPFEPGPNGTKLACAGTRSRLSGRASADWGPLLGCALQYAHAVTDDASRTSVRRRHDASAGLTVRSRPTDRVDLRLRTSYLHRDLLGEAPLERSLGNAFEVGWRLPSSLALRLRYDLAIHLDARPATLARIPSPEHRLRFEAEVPL